MNGLKAPLVRFAIDSIRAKKATTALRDAWFDRVDRFIKELHQHQQELVSWETFDDVPRNAKYMSTRTPPTRPRGAPRGWLRRTSTRRTTL